MFGFNNSNKKFVISVEFTYYDGKKLCNTMKFFYEKGSLINLNLTENLSFANKFNSKNDALNFYEDIKNGITLDILNQLCLKYLKKDISVTGYRLSVMDEDLKKEHFWSQSYFK